MERELVSIFLYQKLKEILIRYSKIILTASKDILKFNWPPIGQFWS